MMDKTIIYIIFNILFSIGCIKYYQPIHADITNYKTYPNKITQSGIEVDTGKYTIDLLKIDQYVNELETCLQIKIKRKSFLIKFPNDVYKSVCTGRYLFPCKASTSVCNKKIKSKSYKLLPTSPCSIENIPCKKCPCHCQGAIQHNWIIITTPDMLTFKAELSRLVLGIINPWSIEYTRNCI